MYNENEEELPKAAALGDVVPMWLTWSKLFKFESDNG